VLPARLKVTALLSLLATALLALAVAHGRAPYAFEDSAVAWLGPPSSIGAWSDLVDVLGPPAIGAAVVASFAFGLARRGLLRVAFYAALAAATFLISEHVAKPLVQRTHYGELTFPSGRVTAVSATAVAMWLALYPLLGKRARKVTLVLGAAWALLMSLAVVGAHLHTPLDDVGSLLLSVGVVTAGAAVFEQAATRRPSMPAGRARGGGRE
jgi:membrane-associated phospholipid phosphatase